MRIPMLRISILLIALIASTFGVHANDSVHATSQQLLADVTEHAMVISDASENSEPGSEGLIENADQHCLTHCAMLTKTDYPSIDPGRSVHGLVLRPFTVRPHTSRLYRPPAII